VDREHRRRLEEHRRETAGPAENTLIDELTHGDMSRAEFMRRASVFGLSIGIVGALAGCGSSSSSSSKGGAASSAAGKPGGRMRVGVTAPAGAIEPHLFADTGALQTGSINGEFLNRATQSLTLVPELALSWKPNKDASIWTYKLRPGVMFQNGQAMTAADVVTTYDRLVDPKSGSQALSAYGGVLSPGGITKVDDLTVQFKLDAPTANFPYLTSSQVYQAIILPAAYKLGTYTKTPQATGAFILRSYTPGVGAKYDRNPHWWAGKSLLDGVDVTYYNQDTAQNTALLGGQLDLIAQLEYFSGGQALVHNPAVHIFGARGAAHREICMRTDQAPFTDVRVRRALALTLNRPDMIKTLVGGLADLGNDNPFAPVFRSTDASVPQRHQDLAQARALLQAAGHANNLNLTITTHQIGELPAICQVLQASAKMVGVNIKINVETTQTYFGGTAVGGADGYGNTPWLNTPLNVTDWGHRAVPNVYLTSSFVPKGVWNASRYSNKTYDSLAKSYIAALSLVDQKKYAGQIETMLLNDTPVIFPYFYEYLSAGNQKVRGYQADAIGGVYLSRASLA